VSAFIRSLGGLWFCVMVAGLSSFADNLNGWGLLIGLIGAGLTAWGGAFRDEVVSHAE